MDQESHFDSVRSELDCLGLFGFSCGIGLGEELLNLDFIGQTQRIKKNFVPRAAVSRSSNKNAVLCGDTQAGKVKDRFGRVIVLKI